MTSNIQEVCGRKNLKRGLKSQQSLFTKANTEQESATCASLRVALEIGKRGKPFTDGEMIKEFLIAVAEEICPEKVNLFKFLDESTDVSDTVQVLIFIRIYEVYEELLDIDSVYGMTTGADFDVIANEIKLFRNPFDSDIETLTLEDQIEIIELQCSDMIKNKYEN
ncbi:unnamed protein product [Parnassius apollo]|uniref:(apollo) hypothetical protein n=1 Tax=Parnassius apollo TaxID=110799 RepID=A0A8S3WV63_PARAO|nr:unnamed protein product [Parnassius apollo]